NLGEDLRISLSTLCFDLDHAIRDAFASALQDHHDIECSASTQAQQQHLHRSKAEVASTELGRAIHDDAMSRSGLAEERDVFDPFDAGVHSRCWALGYRGGILHAAAAQVFAQVLGSGRDYSGLGAWSEDYTPPKHRYLISRYSSRPYFEPSRPSPDSLMPPNGATSVEMIPSLMPTMPHSSASATRQTRWMFVL